MLRINKSYTPEITNYQYDAAGRLTEVQYPSGITESYTYDSTGNRITLSNSITGTTSYAYDDENKLLSASSPAANTKYSYDIREAWYRWFGGMTQPYTLTITRGD